MRLHVLATLFCLSPVVLLGQTVGPLVAPGLSIPNARTPWALDHTDSGDRLVPIHHSIVDVNNHNAANIAGSLTQSFFYKPKWSVDLGGVHSKCHLHGSRPTFYLRSDEEEETADDAAKGTTYQWALVRARIDKDHRLFSQSKINQFNHKATRQSDTISATLTRLENGWIRIAVDQPMENGEYALMQIPASSKYFSERVYDFSLDPTSPDEIDALRAK